VQGPALAAWARVFLSGQAVVFAILGLALLVARDAMVDVYAYCSWRYSRRRTWTELAAIVPAMLVFTAGTVVASLMHDELFSTSDLATWVWFVGYGGAAAVLLAMGARTLPAALSDRPAAPAPAV
jgi:hypothetical protein